MKTCISKIIVICQWVKLANKQTNRIVNLTKKVLKVTVIMNISKLQMIMIKRQIVMITKIQAV